jgi:hypothetical protein
MQNYQNEQARLRDLFETRPRKGSEECSSPARIAKKLGPRIPNAARPARQSSLCFDRKSWKHFIIVVAVDEALNQFEATLRVEQSFQGPKFAVSHCSGIVLGFHCLAAEHGIAILSHVISHFGRAKNKPPVTPPCRGSQSFVSDVRRYASTCRLLPKLNSSGGRTPARASNGPVLYSEGVWGCWRLEYAVSRRRSRFRRNGERREAGLCRIAF